eukprot:gnl/TRDRNA2_/TRDRNA2_169613_c1_seq1.p1 gnl/TRDRNA2_/TRDRNA2_169613_c1~~gnl/TRDRNA2_/TRDRNA2_169613_c1_seq1.p1  ORF type:complete len:197 (-),score=13.36 gnl/TRDRNA2_/TRDRNA2_169613_c1_seq1:411-947(-)
MATNHCPMVKLNAVSAFAVLNIWTPKTSNPDTFLAVYPGAREALEMMHSKRGSDGLFKCPNCSLNVNSSHYNSSQSDLRFNPVTVPPEGQNPSTALIFWGGGMPHASFGTQRKGAHSRISREERFLVVPSEHLNLILRELSASQHREVEDSPSSLLKNVVILAIIVAMLLVLGPRWLL